MIKMQICKVASQVQLKARGTHVLFGVNDCISHPLVASSYANRQNELFRWFVSDKKKNVFEMSCLFLGHSTR